MVQNSAPQISPCATNLSLFYTYIKTCKEYKFDFYVLMKLHFLLRHDLKVYFKWWFSLISKMWCRENPSVRCSIKGGDPAVFLQKSCKWSQLSRYFVHRAVTCTLFQHIGIQSEWCDTVLGAFIFDILSEMRIICFSGTERISGKMKAVKRQLKCQK